MQLRRLHEKEGRMKRSWLRSVALVALTTAATANAADLAVKAPPAPEPSWWELDTGVRYWVSSGRMAKDLFSNINPNVMVSRLTYDKTDAQSAEQFYRFEHRPTGLFVKGFFGRGAITNGKMNDEDFAPVAVPTYSNTLQETHNGTLSYFTVDGGWMFYDGMRNPPKPGEEGLRAIQARLGIFGGYNEWSEFARTYGCSQQAGGGVCAPSPITTGQYSLGQDNTWRNARVGITGDVAMGPAWTLTFDAAYTRTELDGFDHHKLRPDIDPLHETGTGNGFQLEAVAKYHVTDNFDIGVGARYWRNFVNGSVTFPGARTASPERWEADRLGVFVQAGAKFDSVSVAKTNDAITAPGASSIWNGFYGGFNVGSGYGKNSASIQGANALGAALIAAGVFPASLSVGEDGHVAGVQTGYNWHVSPQFVLGAEVDFDYAKLGGAEARSAVFGLGGGRFELLNTTVDRQTNWLGTARGRVGFLASPSMLLYGTAGLAFGETTLHIEQNDSIVGPGAFTTSGARTNTKISTGYAAGAGVEYAISRWASIKGEWLHVDLGIQNSGVNVLNASQVTASIRNSTELVRGGMNFKF